MGSFAIWLQKMDRDEQRKSQNFSSSLKQVCSFSSFSDYVTLTKNFPMLVDPVSQMTNLKFNQKVKVHLTDLNNNSPTGEHVDVTSLYLAKDGIRPEWEDPRFKDGCYV